MRCISFFILKASINFLNNMPINDSPTAQPKAMCQVQSGRQNVLKLTKEKELLKIAW